MRVTTAGSSLNTWSCSGPTGDAHVGHRGQVHVYPQGGERTGGGAGVRAGQRGAAPLPDQRLGPRRQVGQRRGGPAGLVDRRQRQHGAGLPGDAGQLAGKRRELLLIDEVARAHHHGAPAAAALLLEEAIPRLGADPVDREQLRHLAAQVQAPRRRAATAGEAGNRLGGRAGRGGLQLGSVARGQLARRHAISAMTSATSATTATAAAANTGRRRRAAPLDAWLARVLLHARATLASTCRNRWS